MAAVREQAQFVSQKPLPALFPLLMIPQYLVGIVRYIDNEWSVLLTSLGFRTNLSKSAFLATDGCAVLWLVLRRYADGCVMRPHRIHRSDKKSNIGRRRPCSYRRALRECRSSWIQNWRCPSTRSSTLTIELLHISVSVRSSKGWLK